MVLTHLIAKVFRKNMKAVPLYLDTAATAGKLTVGNIDGMIYRVDHFGSIT